MDAARVVLLVAGLAAAVALRWAAQTRLAADGLAVGTAFGAALLVLAAAAWRRDRSRLRAARTGTAMPLISSMVVGVCAGLVLVAIAAAFRPVEALSLRPAAPLVPWAVVTTLVAGSEEAIFRGALFGALDRIAGPLVALALTSALFALMHVPFYGIGALPLDVAVGLVLGGLRLASGGIAAPIAAHVTADLATWWL